MLLVVAFSNKKRDEKNQAVIIRVNQSLEHSVVFM